MAGRNFGKQAKAQERRDARDHLALAQSEVDAASLYEPPDEHLCDVKPQEVYLDDDNQILMVMYMYESRLVRLFYAWQTRAANGEWIERYSVCTLHGYLHEHTTGHQQPNDHRSIMPLRSQTDVQECNDRAFDLVYDRYWFAHGGPYG